MVVGVFTLECPKNSRILCRGQCRFEWVLLISALDSDPKWSSRKLQPLQRPLERKGSGAAIAEVSSEIGWFVTWKIQIRFVPVILNKLEAATNVGSGVKAKPDVSKEDVFTSFASAYLRSIFWKAALVVWIQFMTLRLLSWSVLRLDTCLVLEKVGFSGFCCWIRPLLIEPGWSCQ